MTLLRFRDLKDRRIVGNHVTLKRWIEREGFPPGRMLGPNTRVWRESEIDAWLDLRPAQRVASFDLSRPALRAHRHRPHSLARVGTANMHRNSFDACRSGERADADSRGGEGGRMTAQKTAPAEVLQDQGRGSR